MALPTLPSLPTDNLYKFLAIFGLVLTIFSFYISFETLDKNIAYKQRMLEGYIKTVDSIMNETTMVEIVSESKKKERADQPAKLFKDQVNRQLYEVRESRRNYYKTLNNTVAIAFFSGIIMMLIGFYYWYHRVQQPLDEITKMELAKKKNDLIESNPTEHKDSEETINKQ